MNQYFFFAVFPCFFLFSSPICFMLICMCFCIPIYGTLSLSGYPSFFIYPSHVSFLQNFIYNVFYLRLCLGLGFLSVLLLLFLLSYATRNGYFLEEYYGSIPSFIEIQLLWSASLKTWQRLSGAETSCSVEDLIHV